MPFNAAFVARLLPRLHWEALLSAAESVSGNGGGVGGSVGAFGALEDTSFGVWGGFWALGSFGGRIWVLGGFWGGSLGILGSFWVELGLCGDLGGEGSPHSCFIFAPSLISASSYFTSALITPCPHYFMFLHINFFLNFFPLPPLINAPLPPRSVTPQLCPPAPPHLMMLRRNSCFGCTTSCWR